METTASMTLSKENINTHQCRNFIFLTSYWFSETLYWFLINNFINHIVGIIQWQFCWKKDWNFFLQYIALLTVLQHIVICRSVTPVSDTYCEILANTQPWFSQTVLRHFNTGLKNETNSWSEFWCLTYCKDMLTAFMNTQASASLVTVWFPKPVIIPLMKYMCSPCIQHFMYSLFPVFIFIALLTLLSFQTFFFLYCLWSVIVGLCCCDEKNTFAVVPPLIVEHKSLGVLKCPGGNTWLSVDPPVSG